MWRVSRGAAVLAAMVGAVGCGTIDLGDNIVPPDLHLDDNFFYCEIQPNVIAKYGCATGMASEAGSCHDSRSALRLDDTSDLTPAQLPTCQNDKVTGGSIPADYRANLHAVTFTVQSDPLSSPFYRRPVGLDSHPRVIFAQDSHAAQLIVEWINRGGL